MIFIGIDPGVSGGIAAIDELSIVIAAEKMPPTEADVLDLLRRWPVDSTPTRAVLERVSSSPQMGVVSAFTFGKGYGALRMALQAEEIPFDEVVPAKWQAFMMCRSGGDKNITKRRAQQLFPNTKITHAIADALLLAEYARRTETARRCAK